jgi:hypothetical protein
MIGSTGRGEAMQPDTRRALLRLAGLLQERAIPFQLGGSGLLYAHGLIDRVGDLDLVFAAGARNPLREVLWEMTGTEPDFAVSQEPGFVSAWRCVHEIDGQAFDLTGGVTVMVAGAPRAIPFETGPVWEVDGVDIPLAPPEPWWLIYTVHGGTERAALLEELLDRDRLSLLLDRLGMDEVDLT